MRPGALVAGLILLALGVAMLLDTTGMMQVHAGRLVAPFDLRVPLASAYFLVCHESASTRPAVALFRDWLLEEAARDTRSP